MTASCYLIQAGQVGGTTPKTSGHDVLSGHHIQIHQGGDVGWWRVWLYWGWGHKAGESTDQQLDKGGSLTNKGWPFRLGLGLL